MAKSTVKGVDVLAKNISKFGDGFLKEVNRDMDHIAKILKKQITKNRHGTGMIINNRCCSCPSSVSVFILNKNG